MLNKIGHFIGLFLILILLFAAKSFLGTHPLLSCLCFLFFSCLYLITTIQTKENLFIYPVLFFGTLSYYLFLHLIKVPTYTFPAFSLLFVFSLLVAVRLLEKRNKQYFTIPLYRGMLFTSIIFTGWIFWRPGYYYSSMAVIPAVTFFGYAVFYYLRNSLSFKVRHLYSALLYFAAFYIAMLYVIKLIDPSLYGLLLMILVGLNVLTGTSFHKSRGIKDSMPFYVVGLVVLLLSFIYSGHSVTLLPIALFICSLVYWTAFKRLKAINTTIKLTSTSEKIIPKQFLLIINLAGVAVICQFIIQAFPLNLINIVIALSYTVFFTIIAIERKITFVKIRNHYIYLAGSFFILFFLLLLFFIRPFTDLQLCLGFSIVLLIGVLFLAGLLERKGETLLSRSALDISYLVAGSAFILSFYNQNYSAVSAAILAALFLIVYLGFMRLHKSADLHYGLIIIASYVYYNILLGVGISQQMMGILFLPISLIFMIITYTYYNKTLSSRKVFYFGWFLFSVLSIILSYPYLTEKFVCFSICAVSFLLMGQALVSINKRRLET